MKHRTLLLAVGMFMFNRITFGQKTDSTYLADLKCKDIETEVDKFDGTIFHGSNILKPVCFQKYVTKDRDTAYYIRLQVAGSTLNVAEKGVIVLLSDTIKLEWPEAKVDIDFTTYGYKYTAFITLSKSDLELFSKNYITDFRLFIYDYSLGNNEMIRFRDNINCLIYKF